jgi:hypothetical protein
VREAVGEEEVEKGGNGLELFGNGKGNGKWKEKLEMGK